MTPRLLSIAAVLLTACTIARSEPPPRVNYSLDAALGGGVVGLGKNGHEICKALAARKLQIPANLEQWIAGLASDSFDEREQAMRELLIHLREHAEVIVPRLETGIQSTEPEVRLRCRKLLKVSPPQTLDGLLEWIHLERISGMLAYLEELPTPAWDERRLRRLPDVVEAAAAEADRGRLLEWTRHGEAAFRQAAIRALSKLGALDPLATLADDPATQVQLEVALQWGKQSNPRCVPLFKKLLADDDFIVRSTSAYALQELSGWNHGFPGTAEPEKRKEIAAAWKNQVIEKPRFPLQLHQSAVSNSPTGRKLFLLEAGQGRLRKYDQDGKLLSTLDVPFTSSGNDIIPMPGGDFLLAGENLDGSYEWKKYSAENKVTRQAASRYYPCPTMVSNGNLLICERNEVYELNPAGKEIFSKNLPGQRGRNSWRTAYGTTLVALSQSIIELDQDGKTVWQHNIAGDMVTCCQGLPNGNILVVLRLSNRVIELTHDGQTVWQWKPSNGTVRDCFMLPSGNLLATTDAGALEVSRGGHVLWEIEEAGIWQVRRGE